ncbi:uncharacterized protein LOC108100805 [Drosophila ficusphila]|uniref:uncharacterized protein LOC108100805 n=1 Tax=Drosophila ficusphila TaxID=30025 RepID=UPI0007E5E5C5|nr:uncharacterized protein LOC108100805 [Drosophila ficusphila]
MATYTCTQFLNLDEMELPSKVTTVTLNASCFGQCDLNIFIESLETIARLEKERHERRQLRREKKRQLARMAELNDQRSSSPTPSADEAVDEPLLYLEAKCIPYAVSDAPNVQRATTPGLPEYYTCDDEAYGTGFHSPGSSVTYCSCNDPWSQDSDSAESGVYGSVSVAPVRPRSQMATKSENRSTRSRIIRMLMKREFANTPLTEHQQQAEPRCKYSSRKLSTEQSFLDKALRYLTL